MRWESRGASIPAGLLPASPSGAESSHSGCWMLRLSGDWLVVWLPLNKRYRPLRAMSNGRGIRSGQLSVALVRLAGRTVVSPRCVVAPQRNNASLLMPSPLGLVTTVRYPPPPRSHSAVLQLSVWDRAAERHCSTGHLQNVDSSISFLACDSPISASTHPQLFFFAFALI